MGTFVRPADHRASRVLATLRPTAIEGYLSSGRGRLGVSCLCLDLRNQEGVLVRTASLWLCPL